MSFSSLLWFLLISPMIMKIRRGLKANRDAAPRLAANALQLFALLDLAKFSIAQGLRLFPPVKFI